MARDKVYGLTESQMNAVRDTVRHYMNLYGGGQRRAGDVFEVRPRRGVLTADLGAPVSSLAEMASATFKFLELQPDGTSVLLPTEYTGYNNDPEFSASSGQSISVLWIDGRWLIVKSGGESGSKIISFAIISSDPTLRSAQVEIRQRSFTGTVFGSTLDDTVVTVYDTDGCYLNEPNVDLTGRNGKAVLMYVDAEAEAAHFPDYDVPTQYWNVLSLCCPNVVCE